MTRRANRTSQRIYEVDQQFPNSGDYAHQSQDGYLQPWERDYGDEADDGQYEYHDPREQAGDSGQAQYSLSSQQGARGPSGLVEASMHRSRISSRPTKRKRSGPAIKEIEENIKVKVANCNYPLARLLERH